MNELPFSSTDYAKLNYKVFPTIRRRDKYGAENDTVEVTHGEYGERETIGHATIIAKETRTLEDMNPQFLCHDTQSDTFEEAVDSINEFYRNPIGMEEDLTLYWLKWVDQ